MISSNYIIPLLPLDSQSALNNELLKTYESIKEWRSWDNGHANNQYFVDYKNACSSSQKFQENISLFLTSDNLSKYSEILDIGSDDLIIIREHLKSTINFEDDEDFIKYYMYDLALVLRDYDGHSIDENPYEESDSHEGTEYYNKDYHAIIELKQSQPFDFLCKVLEVIANRREQFKSPFTSDMGVDASVYFVFMYSMILVSICNKSIIE